MAIERKFIQQNLKEFQIKEHIFNSLGKVGVAYVKLQRTPLGEKILVSCSRPGLVVGRGGSNIQKITQELKDDFGLENPQIEIEELVNPMLEPDILAEMISNSLERFGPARFKGIGYKALSEAMRAGAKGVEILISGVIPSQRSKVWRFYAGYLKKSGDVAVEGVNVAYRVALLKRGSIGIKVSVMPPTTVLPDEINIVEPEQPVVQDVSGTEEAKELETVVKESKKEAGEKKEEKAPEEKPAKKAVKKKAAKKKAAKKTTKKAVKKAAKKEKEE